jgi:MoxR-like ATPase
MLDGKVLATLAKQHTKAFESLAELEVDLNSQFYDLSEPILALVLAAASGEPLLFIGPPGTAKSRLIQTFCGFLGYLDQNNPSADHEDYFEYLLTPFTEPGELFGYYDPAQAMKGNLTRIDQNMLQNARVVYLDEIFNGSTAILNSILAFLNERIFHDRGKRTPVNMEWFFAATNTIPESSELRAVLDRLVLRCRMDNVEASPTAVGELLKAGWSETYGGSQRKRRKQSLLADMQKFRAAVRRLTSQGRLVPAEGDKGITSELARMIQQARLYELSEMSNRRLVKILYLMMVHRIYRAVKTGEIGNQISLEEEELSLVPRFFLDRYDDEDAISRLERVAYRANL